MSYLPVMMMGWNGLAAGAGSAFRRRPGRCGSRRTALRATPTRDPGGDWVTRLREIAAPFVAAVPAGARVRARLRVSAQDAQVLAAVGRHLGSLAGRDLAARCAEGRLDSRARAASRAVRKRALTAESSSRWAGAITRTSEDAWQLAARNLAAGRGTLKARVRKIETRLAAPAGKKIGRVSGYATPAERHGKAIRLKALKGRLARVERQLADGAVSVTRGGRRLMRARLSLADGGVTEAQWRQRWDARRLFLTADGEKDKAWGNETLRWNPEPPGSHGRTKETRQPTGHPAATAR
jgi:hypothetical protein